MTENYALPRDSIKVDPTEFYASPYLYIAPITLLLTLISLFPLVYNLYMSFRDYSLLDPFGSKFVGFGTM